MGNSNKRSGKKTSGINAYSGKRYPETIERIYNMAVDGDDIRNYTAKQIKRKFGKKDSWN